MADAVFCVDNGLALITGLLAASSFNFVAWGTGAGAAVATSSALGTPAAPTATNCGTAGTGSRQTTTTTNDTYQVTKTITAQGAVTITEVGIFNQAALSGATMFLHGSFTGIPLNANDSIAFTLKVQLTN